MFTTANVCFLEKLTFFVNAKFPAWSTYAIIMCSKKIWVERWWSWRRNLRNANPVVHRAHQASMVIERPDHLGINVLMRKRNLNKYFFWFGKVLKSAPRTINSAISIAGALAQMWLKIFFSWEFDICTQAFFISRDCRFSNIALFCVYWCFLKI